MEISLIKWQEQFYMDFFRQSNDDDLYSKMSDGFPRTLDASVPFLTLIFTVKMLKLHIGLVKSIGEEG